MKTTMTKKEALRLLRTAKRSLELAKESVAEADRSDKEKKKALKLAGDYRKFSDKVLKSADRNLRLEILHRGFIVKALSIQNKQMVDVELFLKTLKTPTAAKAIKSLNVAHKVIVTNLKKAGFKSKASK